MAEPGARALTDSEIHRSVAETVMNVIMPALRDDADWARAVATQLVGLVRYAQMRGPDRTHAFVEELAEVLERMSSNEIVARVWDADRSPRSVMEAAGAALALAVGRKDAPAAEVRSVLRPVVVRQLDDELTVTTPLIDAFRGHLDG